MIKIMVISDLVGGVGGVYTYLQQIKFYTRENIVIHFLLDVSTKKYVTENYELGPIKFIPLSNKKHSETKIIESVIAVINDLKPNLIHFVNGSIKSNLLIREYLSSQKIPFIVTEQFIDESLILPLQVLEKIQNVNLSALHTIYVSSSNEKSAREIFNIFKNYSIIFNSVFPLEMKKSYYSKNPYRFFTTSRCVKQKGIDIIIKAISLIKHHRIEFHIFGDGEDKLELQDLAKALFKPNHEFIIHGWLRQVDYRKMLNDFDLFISASRHEGFSFSLLEAATAGFPIICSNCSGNDELVGICDYGVLFDSENHEQLYSLLNDYLSNPYLLNNNAYLNTLHVDKKFNIITSIAQLETLYRLYSS